MGSKTATRDGWKSVRFGDIAEQINDRVDDPTAAGVDRYVGLEHLDPGSLRVTRWGSPDEVSAQKLRFHPGDIIFGKRRAYQRKVAVADFGGICSAHAMVLRERAGTIAPGFLIHFMTSNAFMDRAVQISVGSLSPTINWSTLRDQEFNIPSIEEQYDLVSMLAAADEAVRCVGLAHTASQDLFRAFADHQVALIERDITPEPLVNHLDVLTVGIVVKPAALYVPQTDDGVLALRSLNITPHRIVLDDVVRISREGHASHAKSALRSGDVAVVRTGRAGDAAVIPDELNDVNCIDLIIMRPRDSLNPHFLALFLNSTAGRALFSSGATGTAQQHFNVGACKQLKLAIPPRKIQDKIVEAAAALLASTQAIKARHDAATRLQKCGIATGT